MIEVVVRLKCGHSSDWTVRLVDRGERYSFCLGCMFEKLQMTDIRGKIPPKIYPNGKREFIESYDVVTKDVPEKTPKKTKVSTKKEQKE